MKAAAFEYTRVSSLGEACALLAEHGDDAKVIAGGQSLVPMLAMRLLAPMWLIDVARVAELQGITFAADKVIIGSCVRQGVADTHAQLAGALPILKKALRWVGHTATRTRGTMGGSLAHADPSAELPLVVALLEASLKLQSTRGVRALLAKDFFIGPMMTALEADECLVDITLPIWSGKTGSAFEEIATRHGDFAIVAAAAQVSVDASGRCTRAALAIGGAGPVPHAFNALAKKLVGSKLETTLLREIAQEAASLVEPTNDLQATAAYRHHLAGVLAERALIGARDEALA